MENSEKPLLLVPISSEGVFLELNGFSIHLRTKFANVQIKGPLLETSSFTISTNIYRVLTICQAVFKVLRERGECNKFSPNGAYVLTVSYIKFYNNSSHGASLILMLIFHVWSFPVFTIVLELRSKFKPIYHKFIYNGHLLVASTASQCLVLALEFWGCWH